MRGDVPVDVDVRVDVNLWFSDPGNRYSCWTDRSGWQFGYVFCGSRLFWYWWLPGCDPFFSPYRYYWSPSCTWLPCYYPSYSTVRVVHEYVDTVDYYPTYVSSESPPAGMDVAALLTQGWQEFGAGEYLAAVETLRQAVLAAPDDPFAKIAFGQALFALGNYADAAFVFRRAAELLPDWPAVGEDPRSRYGDALDHAEQMVALRTFLELVPGDPAATLTLAVQSFFTGDLSVARDAFSLLEELDPTDAVAARFLVHLRGGSEEGSGR